MKEGKRGKKAKVQTSASDQEGGNKDDGRYADFFWPGPPDPPPIPNPPSSSPTRNKTVLSRTPPPP
eukprot:1161601-Pelagomonas_calceolata.AAC.15